MGSYTLQYVHSIAAGHVILFLPAVVNMAHSISQQHNENNKQVLDCIVN